MKSQAITNLLSNYNMNPVAVTTTRIPCAKKISLLHTSVDAVWRMQFLFSFRNFIVLNILHAIWKEFNLKDNIAYKVINLLAIYLNYEHWTWTYCLIRLVNGISAFYFHRHWRCFSCFFNLMLHCQVEMSINWRSAWTWN